MKVYVVSDLDMGYVARVFKDQGAALTHLFSMLTNSGYTSFTLAESDELDRAWEITFPHKVESCTAHWRIEEMELE